MESQHLITYTFITTTTNSGVLSGQNYSFTNGTGCVYQGIDTSTWNSLGNKTYAFYSNSTLNMTAIIKFTNNNTMTFTNHDGNYTFVSVFARQP